MESKLDEKVNGWAIIQGERQKPPITADEKEKQRYRSDCAATIRTIKESISDDMHTLVVGEMDPKALWNKLKDSCNKKGQGVVYAILQEMLNYPKITKPKGYDKAVIQSCAEVKTLARRLRDSIAEGKNVIDSFAIVIWLDSLHEDFDNVIATLLDADKSMEDMQEILSSHEQKSLSKRATGVPSEVAMNTKGSNSSGKQREGPKCYNCQKYGHIAKDCSKPNRRDKRKAAEEEEKTEKEEQKRKKTSGKGSGRGGRAHQTKSKSKKDTDDDSDDDGYRESASIVTMAYNLGANTGALKKEGGWWLDSAASRHISNDRNKFLSIRDEVSDQRNVFFTAKKGEYIVSAGIGDCNLTLRNGENMYLKDVSYVPGLDTDLISLGQLQKDGWSFQSTDQGMLLIRDNRPIVVAMKVGAMYWISAVSPRSAKEARMVSGRGRPTHQEPSSPVMKLWHRRMGHPSNRRLIVASKLLDDMDLGENADESESMSEDESDKAADVLDQSESELSAIDDYMVDEKKTNCYSTTVRRSNYEGGDNLRAMYYE